MAREHVEYQVVRRSSPCRLRHDPRRHDDLLRQREDLEQPREVLEDDAEPKDVLAVGRRRLLHIWYDNPDHKLQAASQEDILLLFTEHSASNIKRAPKYSTCGSGSAVTRSNQNVLERYLLAIL
jgi:hypothetical protein